jgi:hypothetical protein
MVCESLYVNLLACEVIIARGKFESLTLKSSQQSDDIVTDSAFPGQWREGTAAGPPDLQKEE